MKVSLCTLDSDIGSATAPVKVDIDVGSSNLSYIGLSSNGSGDLSANIGAIIWNSLDLSKVIKLKCCVSSLSLWNSSVIQKFSSLKVLRLERIRLNILPSMVGEFSGLEELYLSGNYLKILPPELGQLQRLRVLDASRNQLSLLRGELRRCTALEELNLEYNRLEKVIIPVRDFKCLHTLRLGGNELGFLPEIGPCEKLKTLTVADFVLSDEKKGPNGVQTIYETKFAEKVKPMLSLMLQHSSVHHPLLSGSLRHWAENYPDVRREILKEERNYLPQLVSMALSDNPLVVSETCSLLSLLVEDSPILATKILDILYASSIIGLMRSPDSKIQKSGLELIGTICSNSEDAVEKLLSDGRFLADLLSHALEFQEEESVWVESLKVLGNLAFSRTGKIAIKDQGDVLARLERLSHSSLERNCLSAIDVPVKVRSAAIRALAILGNIDAVASAVGRQSPRSRGLRILTMDGGGMKGLATVRLLKALEERIKCPIHSVFDLIVGTSTGGLLTVAIALRKFSLEECEDIYKVLGRKVFARPAVNESRESWMDIFTRTFQLKTEHVRAVVVGHKHDASVYEDLLKNYCTFRDDDRCLSDRLIDTTPLDVPKVALVSTLGSNSPPIPFVFRNYEVCEAYSGAHLNRGSSKYEIWQAVRASSAAIYYLDDFTCGTDTFHDGAVTSNNPSLVAVQEARALWPNTPIDVIVSLGTGSTPHRKRENASGFIAAGSIMLESATNVNRAHETLSTFTPLVPGLKYFRFDPVDDRCEMDLDEIDPHKWMDLELAVDEYVENNVNEIAAAAACLVDSSHSREPETQMFQSICKNKGKKYGLLLVKNSFHIETDVSVTGKACFLPPFCVSNLDLGSEFEMENDSKEKVSEFRHPSSSVEEGKQIIALEKSQNEPEEKKKDKSSPSTPLKDFSEPSNLSSVEFNVNDMIGSTISWGSSWFSPWKRDPSQIVLPESELDSKSENALEINCERKGNTSLKSNQSLSTESEKQVSHEACKIQRQKRGYFKFKEEVIKHSKDAHILHLCLPSCSTGLILIWEENFCAIPSVGDESSQLVKDTGYDPSQISLVELFEKKGGRITSNGLIVELINSQYLINQHHSRKLQSVLLLRKMTPIEVMDHQDIMGLADVLRGKIVIVSDTLPDACLEALKRCDVVGIVSPIHPLNDINVTWQASFFEALYAGIQEREDLEVALEYAESSSADLKGLFKIERTN